jgi:hypothetical protein
MQGRRCACVVRHTDDRYACIPRREDTQVTYVGIEGGILTCVTDVYTDMSHPCTAQEANTIPGFARQIREAGVCIRWTTVSWWVSSPTTSKVRNFALACSRIWGVSSLAGCLKSCPVYSHSAVLIRCEIFCLSAGMQGSSGRYRSSEVWIGLDAKLR